MGYKINGKSVTDKEWEDYFKDRPKWKPGDGTPYMTMGFEPFRSPIDGKIIKNNRDLANHERQHDVIQVGTEIDKPSWQKEKKHIKKEKMDKIKAEMNDEIEKTVYRTIQGYN